MNKLGRGPFNTLSRAALSLGSSSRHACCCSECNSCTPEPQNFSLLVVGHSWNLPSSQSLNVKKESEENRVWKSLVSLRSSKQWTHLKIPLRWKLEPVSFWRCWERIHTHRRKRRRHSCPYQILSGSDQTAVKIPNDCFSEHISELKVSFVLGAGCGARVYNSRALRSGATF